ncbi:hypothetical protein ACWD5B_15555, partial [Streptomyces tanashiensis]
MISTAEQLLAALEPLPHAARLRLTAVTAHRLAARGAVRPLLTALAAGGPYERRLAQQTVVRGWLTLTVATLAMLLLRNPYTGSGE